MRQTKDGGWICGEDIDVSVDEGQKKAAEVQDEVVPLEVQLGKGESASSVYCQLIPDVNSVLNTSLLYSETSIERTPWEPSQVSAYK